MSAMGLKEAGQLWLASKIDQRRKPRTLEACRGYLARLEAFFQDARLDAFSAGSLVAYQQWRAQTAGVSILNHEINALSQILKRAGQWEKIRYNYAPLKEPQWQKPKVLTVEEEQRVFAFAGDDPALELVEIVFTLTRYTSATGCELRLMQLRSIHAEGESPRIEVTGDTTKNAVRPRTIPLIPEALDAMHRALARAHRLGSHFPEHFLFPLRVNRALYNPTRPASPSWLRNQTSKLRQRSGIAHLHPHLFRHQIVTEMLENGVPPETVKAVCGWASQKMIETYSHARYEAKAEALLRTVSKGAAPPQPPQPTETAEHSARPFLVNK